MPHIPIDDPATAFAALCGAHEHNELQLVSGGEPATDSVLHLLRIFMVFKDEIASKLDKETK